MPYDKPHRSEAGGSGALVVVFVLLGVLLTMMLVCGGVAVAFLLPSLTVSRAVSHRVSSTNRLKQIGLALHNYHDTHGSFPMAYVEDEDGNPRYSWRTAILPFLEQEVAADLYDDELAWDSPHNRKVTDMSMPVYQTTGDLNGTRNQTSYLALTGPKSVFDGETRSRFADIKDGASNTIIVVEVVGSNVPWAKPEDLYVDLTKMSGQPGDLDPGGFLALFADGTVRMIRDISPGDLKAFSTRDGMEITLPLD